MRVSGLVPNFSRVREQRDDQNLRLACTAQKPPLTVLLAQCRGHAVPAVGVCRVLEYVHGALLAALLPRNPK